MDKEKVTLDGDDDVENDLEEKDFTANKPIQDLMNTYSKRRNTSVKKPAQWRKEAMWGIVPTFNIK